MKEESFVIDDGKFEKLSDSKGENSLQFSVYV